MQLIKKVIISILVRHSKIGEIQNYPGAVSLKSPWTYVCLRVRVRLCGEVGGGVVWRPYNQTWAGNFYLPTPPLRRLTHTRLESIDIKLIYLRTRMGWSGFL